MHHWANIDAETYVAARRESDRARTKEEARLKAAAAMRVTADKLSAEEWAEAEKRANAIWLVPKAPGQTGKEVADIANPHRAWSEAPFDRSLDGREVKLRATSPSWLLEESSSAVASQDLQRLTETCKKAERDGFDATSSYKAAKETVVQLVNKALSSAIASQNVQELESACREAERAGVECGEAKDTIAHLVDRALSAAVASQILSELTDACEQADRLGLQHKSPHYDKASHSLYLETVLSSALISQDTRELEEACSKIELSEPKSKSPNFEKAKNFLNVIKLLSTAVESQNIEHLTEACRQALAAGLKLVLPIFEQARESIAQLVESELEAALISQNLDQLIEACKRAEAAELESVLPNYYPAKQRLLQLVEHALSSALETRSLRHLISACEQTEKAGLESRLIGHYKHAMEYLISVHRHSEALSAAMKPPQNAWELHRCCYLAKEAGLEVVVTHYEPAMKALIHIVEAKLDSGIASRNISELTETCDLATKAGLASELPSLNRAMEFFDSIRQRTEAVSAALVAVNANEQLYHACVLVSQAGLERVVQKYPDATKKLVHLVEVSLASALVTMHPQDLDYACEQAERFTNLIDPGSTLHGYSRAKELLVIGEQGRLRLTPEEVALVRAEGETILHVLKEKQASKFQEEIEPKNKGTEELQAEEKSIAKAEENARLPSVYKIRVNAMGADGMETDKEARKWKLKRIMVAQMLGMQGTSFLAWCKHVATMKRIQRMFGARMVDLKRKTFQNFKTSARKSKKLKNNLRWMLGAQRLVFTDWAKYTQNTMKTREAERQEHAARKITRAWVRFRDGKISAFVAIVSREGGEFGVKGKFEKLRGDLDEQRRALSAAQQCLQEMLQRRMSAELRMAKIDQFDTEGVSVGLYDDEVERTTRELNMTAEQTRSQQRVVRQCKAKILELEEAFERRLGP